MEIYTKKEIDSYLKSINEKIEKNISIDNGDIEKLITINMGIENEYIKSEIFFKLGKILSLKSNYESAIKFYKKAIKLFKKNRDDIFTEKSYFNIANMHYHLGNFDKSIENLLLSIDLSKKLNDLKGVAISYNTMGAIQFSLENYEESLNYYIKALELFDKETPKKSDKDLDTIAMLNSNIGSVYTLTKNYEKALEHLNESITIRILSKNEFGKAQSYNNIATLFSEKGEYKKAVDFYKKSLKIKEEIDDFRGISASYIGLAELFNKEKNIIDSEYYYKKAEEISKKTKNSTILIHLYQKMSKFYEENGFFKNALNYYKKFISIKEKIFNQNKEKKVEQLKYNYELAEKEHKAEIYRLRNIELKNAYDKIDTLISNILPPNIVKELNETGKVKPKIIKNITVMMTDFKDFTPKSTKLGPKLLISELNDIYTAFDRICDEEGCERIKTIGDAYMAVSNIKDGTPKATKHLINVGFKMIKYLKNRNKNSIENWDIRIGISTGEVIGGIVGVKKYSYDIFGDIVNTAARLESLSEIMTIYSDENTKKFIKDKAEFKYIGEKNMKGKGLQKVYKILPNI